MWGFFNKNKVNNHLSDDDISRIAQAINKENSKRAISDEDAEKIADKIVSKQLKKENEVNATADNMNQINKGLMGISMFLASLLSVGSLHRLWRMTNENCPIQKYLVLINSGVTLLFYLFCIRLIIKKFSISDENFPELSILIFFIVSVVVMMLSFFINPVLSWLNFSCVLICLGNSLYWESIDKMNETRAYNLMMLFISLISLFFAIISLAPSMQ